MVGTMPQALMNFWGLDLLQKRVAVILRRLLHGEEFFANFACCVGGRLDCTVHRSGCTVHRSSCAVHRSGYLVRRTPTRPQNAYLSTETTTL